MLLLLSLHLSGCAHIYMLTMLLCVLFHPMTLLPLRQTARNTDITPAFYSELCRSEQQTLNAP
jgi:hypothetical protein